MWFVFNPNLGKFWRVLKWSILVYFITIWSISLLLEIFYGPLVYFVIIWHIFPPTLCVNDPSLLCYKRPCLVSIELIDYLSFSERV
jgi:hypothetical protein